MAEDRADRLKRLVRDLVEVVWREGDLHALPRFYAEDCVNHAASAESEHGLANLRSYHEAFVAAFAEFEDVDISIEQQVADGELVATRLATRATHTPTGRVVSMDSMRLDRFAGDRVTEHWSVADRAGLTEQLRTP